MERGSSAVECRTRNQVSLGSNHLCYRFEDWAFSFSPLTPPVDSAVEMSTWPDSGENVSDLSLGA